MVGVIVIICAFATSLFITERLFVLQGGGQGGQGGQQNR